jgi:hypothetical protein
MSSLFSCATQSKYAVEDGAGSKSPAVRMGKCPPSPGPSCRILTDPGSNTGLYELFEIQVQMCHKAWRPGL